MQFITKTALSHNEKEAIRQLWNVEYPTVIAHKTPASFDAYLAALADQNHVLVVDENQVIQAWFFDFVRNNERNFAMIVSRQVQGRGLGRKLINQAQTRHSNLNGWVVKTNGLLRVDGSEYPNPKDFYLKCGFTVLEDQIWKTEAFETVKIHWASGHQ
ncbi:MAG: GNAT family N-acetyltransferase [Salibacteraceae bacterium]|nr:GNAT family N-acetyltransferase [Salibacteraceae bacterium]